MTGAERAKIFKNTDATELLEWLNVVCNSLPAVENKLAELEGDNDG